MIYKNEIKTSNLDIANSFNHFFTNIGSAIEAKIPKSKNSCLGDPYCKSLFLMPYDSNELHLLLRQMSTSKASALDNKMYTCGIFVDLEKAFDTVHHNILLLDHYGIRGVANSWFSSYFSNRYQMVSLNGTSSSRQFVTCGVPQRSILGPLLFLNYIKIISQMTLTSCVPVCR